MGRYQRDDSGVSGGVCEVREGDVVGRVICKMVENNEQQLYIHGRVVSPVYRRAEYQISAHE